MAILPTYAELVEQLAVGFGLISGKKDGLQIQRSFSSKQVRYRSSSAKEASGVLPDLLALLAPDASDLQDLLERLLQQYEHLLTHLGTTPLFVELTQEEVEEAFMQKWVWPQLAACLHYLRKHLPQSSPLYYVEQLLPEQSEGIYNPSAKLRGLLKSHLPSIDAVVPFRLAIDKLDVRSNKKYRTIIKELSDLEKNFPDGQREQGKLLAAKLKPIYIAGMAVKRLAEKTEGAGLIFAHLESLDNLDEKKAVFSLAEAHAYLLRTLLKTSLFPVEDYFTCLPALGIWKLFEHHIRAKTAEEHIAAGPLLHMLSNDGYIDAKELRRKIDRLTEHPDREIFKPIVRLAEGILALLEGQAPQALILFREVVALSEKFQLGEFAKFAAGHSIALELLTRKYIPYGSLEPLVSVRIRGQSQSLTMAIPHPTAFGMFDQPVELDISTATIFESIRDYNEYLVTVGSELYINPLGKLESLMALYFELRDISLMTVSQAVEKAIDGERLGRPFYMHSANIYETLRDIWFYIEQFFGREMQIFFNMNTALARFCSLDDEEQRQILSCIDALQYEKDVKRTMVGKFSV